MKTQLLVLISGLISLCVGCQHYNGYHLAAITPEAQLASVMANVPQECQTRIAGYIAQYESDHDCLHRCAAPNADIFWDEPRCVADLTTWLAHTKMPLPDRNTYEVYLRVGAHSPQECVSEARKEIKPAQCAENIPHP